MEKKNNRSCLDELALVKAAAWAWYQHGSGSDEKPMREFDITQTTRAPCRPSRYKLEAMRNNASKTIKGSETTNPIHTQNSLLDSYEIESISKRLGHLIEFSGIKFYDDLLCIDRDYQKKMVLNGGKKNKSNKLKGFLLRRAVVCGRNQDVDDRAVRGEDDQRRPEKHAHVIKMVNCKPWVPQAW
ncbi:uncharacterized protein LOC111288522 [Durio zibethinus]|uniref:Uncharacterized protein LOC111288522 n=1 Tax=Durio zibethinus TaxID=66656 RepID=A0A6P5Y421_DURZI|nr:uncharacterized protein LOC111288522 [Durio zibethinus]